MESKFTSKRNHLDVPLTQPTSQISLFVLGDKISMLHVFMQAVGAHSRSLARRIVNTSDRHLCEIGLCKVCHSQEITALSRVRGEKEGRRRSTYSFKLSIHSFLRHGGG